MRLKSAASIALCLLAFACKKGGSAKDGAQNPPQSEQNPALPESGDQTGSTPAPVDPNAPPTGDVGGGAEGSNPIARVCGVKDCDQALPDPGPKLNFKNSENKIASKFTAYNRGRDQLIRFGQDANIIAKFAYGTVIDKDIKGEDVDIYLSLGCDKGWKKIGSAVTSEEPEGGAARIVDGMEDTGGYVVVSLSSLGVKDLPVGRHRVVLFLRANNDYTDLYIEVIPKNAQIVLSDIDGTLTAFEEAAAGEFLGLPISTHEGAPEMMQAFYERGYTIFYLTARPVFFMEKTRKWLAGKGFPPGVIHTTDKIQGAIGDAAAKYKMNEMAMIKNNLGIVPTYAFGNKPSDVKAFADSGIPKANSWFYKIKGDETGAQAHSDYKGLIPMAKAAPSLCN